MLQLEADVESHLCDLECELDVCKERLDIYDKLREKHATELKIVDRKLIDKFKELFKAQMKDKRIGTVSYLKDARTFVRQLRLTQALNRSIAYVEHLYETHEGKSYLDLYKEDTMNHLKDIGIAMYFVAYGDKDAEHHAKAVVNLIRRIEDAEAARKKAEEEAARKKAEEEAARKKADEDAAKGEGK